ncbi:MAG TPA: hypothetical protein V6D19_18740 [Stenomitos sp.]
MPKLVVRYTVEETVDIDVKDFELTEQEFHELAELKTKTVINFTEAVDWAWECDDEPQFKGSAPIPPDDFWVETSKGEVAVNGWIVLLRNFPIPEGFLPGRPWFGPEEIKPDTPQKLENFLSGDWAKLPLHTGWFRAEFSALKMDGVEVRGKDPNEMGYIILNGQLMGVVMPFQADRKADDAFQFHKTKFVKPEAPLPLLELIGDGK